MNKNEQQSPPVPGQLMAFLESLPGMAYRCRNTPEWEMEYVSSTCLALTGYSQEQLTWPGSTPFSRLIHPDDRDMVWEKIQEAATLHTNFNISYRIIHKSGRIVIVNEEGNALFDSCGNIIAIEGFIVDITRLATYKQKLDEQKLIAEELFEHAPDAIFLADVASGTIVRVNRQAELLTGFEKQELVGRHFSLLHPATTRASAIEGYLLQQKEAEACGRSKPEEYAVLHKSGHTVPVEIISQMITLKNQKLTYGIFRDITERKRAEEARKKLETQLLNWQKLETLGTLSGGIAHDFNNILTPIIGFTELVLESLPPETEETRQLSTVLNAANRAKSLVMQILTFSRQEKTPLEPASLQPIIQDSINFVRHSLPTSITMDTDINPCNCTVMCNPMQLQQVLINLCTNAWQAMEHTKEKILTVKLWKSGTDAAISVSDTGRGMDTQELERAFDPFFTTKKVGKGTGLGLSVVYGIIQAHGGNIEIDSKPGKGSTITFHLPVYEDRNTATPLQE
ncbi:PAS domain-containing sensor histidine kinase [Prosthecochloris sp. CIB 2401]|uniref:PAS domain-containing sensor histidine kinase n=1 Tax=Prosthecochloris sp. CIB 2401 TaxID=1868325 RepID=UPI00080AB8CC|nr:PAS domain-containing sensor histidine kinase [Prosthecochloris sp. CIB 2401]ANT64774.1 Wide host range VirA protein [Prosthecochloris sp. CIB 2401]